MAYYFKNSAYAKKFEVPAILNERIIFSFAMTPRGFPELGQNPSSHLRLSNKNYSVTCNNNDIPALEVF